MTDFLVLLLFVAEFFIIFIFKNWWLSLQLDLSALNTFPISVIRNVTLQHCDFEALRNRKSLICDYYCDINNNK